MDSENKNIFNRSIDNVLITDIMTALLDNIPFDMFVLGKDGRYVFQNKSSIKMWGNFVGKTPWDCAPNNSIYRTWLSNNTRVFNGEVINYETVMELQSGKRTFYNSISPIFYEGEVVGAIGINIDVTESADVKKKLDEFSSIINMRVPLDRLAVESSNELEYIRQSCESVCRRYNYRLVAVARVKNVGDVQELETISSYSQEKNGEVDLSSLDWNSDSTSISKDNLWITSPIYIDNDATYVLIILTRVFSEKDTVIAINLSSDISRGIMYSRASYDLKIFKVMADQAPVSIILTDLNGVITYANKWTSDLTGYGIDEIIGKKPSIFKSGMTPESTYKELWDSLKSKGSWFGILVNRKKDGSLYTEDVSISSIKIGEGFAHYLAIKKDISVEWALQKELSYNAKHDFLTNLFNRSEFESRLSEIINNGNCQKHSVAYIDLDHFKNVNDTVGHQAGDELLKQVSSVISNSIRSRDTLARLGGDEFGVLFDNSTAEESFLVCERIRKSISDWKFTWNNRIFKVTCSIGLSDIPIGSTAEKIMSNIDNACYMAKDSGKNIIKIFQDSEESIKVINLMDWTFRIQSAIEDHHLFFYIQPIVPIKDIRNYNHFEVLLRYFDKNTRLITLPGSFLPAAEKFQLIKDIDRYVVGSMFNVVKNNKKLQNYVFSINISGGSISDQLFHEYVRNLFSSLKHKCNFGFEITETNAVSNYSAAGSFIGFLRDLGVDILLDDFGAGMSSFNYLKHLSITVIKIDGEFVKTVDRDSFNEKVVSFIKELSDLLNLKTVAEFVDSDSVLEKLINIGIDYVQGYIIKKPFPIQCLLCDDNMKDCLVWKSDGNYHVDCSRFWEFQRSLNP